MIIMDLCKKNYLSNTNYLIYYKTHLSCVERYLITFRGRHL